MGRVIEFGAILRGKVMTNGESPIPQLPQVPQGYSVNQLTQINAVIPAHVWTTEALMNLHERQQQIILDNNKVQSAQNEMMDGQRKREFFLSLIFMGVVTAIVLAGIWFMRAGIAGGKEIILGTGAFAAGILAGRGTK